jgi:WD40 repeat protein
VIDPKQIKNPFPGLRSFNSEESHLFFGRDGQCDELLKRLKQNRFLAVVGTSGSGKSSLVRAGLLPAVHGGFITDAGSHWRVAIFRPGDNPIKNLAEALSHPGVLKGKRFSKEHHNIFVQTVNTEIVLRQGSLGLVKIFQQSRLPKEENLLIVVDQFEELFRFKESGWLEHASDEAAAFVKLLLETVGKKEVPIYIVITMRSEFLGECAQFRYLPEAINNSQYLIPRMTRDEKRKAIKGPIAVGGAGISPTLVSRLLNDVGDKPDQLPILQHALLRTWDYWAANHTEGEPLSLKHYEAIGTMERALSQHAEEAYAELKTKKSFVICEKMFKLLTDRGEMGRGVRRPSKISEICSVTNASEEEVIDVINVFRQPGRTFLMPPGEEKLKADSVIDISHESLMRIWKRLIRWVIEEAKSAEQYIELAKRASKEKRGKASFLGDPELMMALKWRENNKPNAAWAKRYHPSFEQTIEFLEASKKQQEHEIEEKEKQREREIRDREKIKELEIKRREEQIRRKRTRIFATIISVISIIAIALAVWALTNRQEAVRQERLAKEAQKKAEEQERIALALKRKEENQRKIAETQTKCAVQQRKIADINAEIAKKNELEAKENEVKAHIEELISGMNKEDATFGQYLAKAKELAVQSIGETRRNDLKALLALTAYQLNNKTYDNLKNNIQNKFKEFKELNARNSLDNVSLSDDLNEIYKSLLRKAENRSQPEEIFNALRKAYITNEDSKDILSPAESRALAVIGDNRIVFNNWKGELLLYSLKLDPNEFKLPVLKKDIHWPKKTLIRASSFAESEDRLFCGTRDGSIIYWEKNNWKENKLKKKYPDPILAMAYSKNKKWLIYLVRNTLYRYSLINKAEPKAIDNKDSLILAFTLVEDSENSFLVYADSKAGSNKKANIYCQRLSGDIKEEKREIGSLNSEGIHAIAYNYSRELLALGDKKGQIHTSKIDYKNLKSNIKPKFHKLNKNHRGIVKTIAFSPGGRYLASCSLDSTIMLWDLHGKNAADIETIAPIVTIDSNQKILSLVFAVTGEYMIFSDEQNLRICPTRPEVFLKKLCKEKGEFTDKEWEDYIGETIKKEDTIICSLGKKK